MEQPPFLSPERFDRACDELLTGIQRIESTELDVRRGGEDGQKYLVLKRPLDIKVSRARGMVSAKAKEPVEMSDQAPEEEEMNDVDEAAVYHNRSVEQTATVEYSILLSATYRVPVLYFGLNNLPPGSPTGIDAVYDYLITEHWRSRLSSVGIMGGISMTNHPVTDNPCFFIHPCNTAEAMTEFLQSRQVSGLKYLQLWIGLVGGCVGLYLPKELAFGS